MSSLKRVLEVNLDLMNCEIVVINKTFTCATILSTAKLCCRKKWESTTVSFQDNYDEQKSHHSCDPHIITCTYIYNIKQKYPMDD